MKIFIGISTLVCFVAAIAMYLIGSNSSHLSELKDYFWVPLIPGVTLLASLRFKKEKA